LIRDALGQGGIGASQGSVLAPAFVAFGIAPMVAATTITLVGPMILIAICIVIQVASAATLAGGFQMYQSMHES
jgi:hypothetical protein